MNTKAKYKICRRLGSNVFEKCQTQKFQLAEARKSKQKSKRRPRAMSDVGKQLLEKQRARFTYGIPAKQLARYVTEAGSEEPIRRLAAKLESRLDNVVFRSGIASTRPMARQMVSHGHIYVNGRRQNTPSYQMQPGDTFAVREQSKDSVLFSEISERLEGYQPPSWLRFDEKKLAGEMVGTPAPDMLEGVFDPAMVLEYYSR